MVCGYGDQFFGFPASLLNVKHATNTQGNQMKKLLLVAAIAFAMSASAQTISGLGDEFNTLAAELPGLNVTMSDNTDYNMRLKKEYDLYITDQTQKKAAVAAAIAVIERDVKAPVEQKLRSRVSEYQARCARTFDRDTEMDQYNQCVADKANIEQEQRDARAWWENYKTIWNKTNVEPVNAVILKQNARIEQIDAQMKANFKLFTGAQDRFIEVKKRLSAITDTMSIYCAKMPPLATNKFTYNEWVKWCSNVDWDGASRKLPPMYKWQG